MIATICLYTLVSVLESTSVKFSALYLVSKVSEKSGIGPPLFITAIRLKEISIYCTLQYIVIYCSVCCLNVVDIQLFAL